MAPGKRHPDTGEKRRGLIKLDLGIFWHIKQREGAMKFKVTIQASCIAAGLLFGGTSALAKAPIGWADIQNLQQGLACTIAKTPTGKTEHITVECDRAKVIANIPMLQQLDIINPDLTETQINLMPNTITMSFLLVDVAGLMPMVYKAVPMDQSDWTVVLKVADLYGHLQTKTAFTFRFNKALFDRINWDNFETQNFAKVAPGFRFSPWLESAVTAEHQ